MNAPCNHADVTLPALVTAGRSVPTYSGSSFPSGDIPAAMSRLGREYAPTLGLGSIEALSVLLQAVLAHRADEADESGHEDAGAYLRDAAGSLDRVAGLLGYAMGDLAHEPGRDRYGYPINGGRVAEGAS